MYSCKNIFSNFLINECANQFKLIKFPEHEEAKPVEEKSVLDEITKDKSKSKKVG